MRSTETAQPGPRGAGPSPDNRLTGGRARAVGEACTRELRVGACHPTRVTKSVTAAQREVTRLVDGSARRADETPKTQ
jgi:hypothetical protein